MTDHNRRTWGTRLFLLIFLAVLSALPAGSAFASSLKVGIIGDQTSSTNLDKSYSILWQAVSYFKYNTAASGRPLKGSGQDQKPLPRRKNTFSPRCFLPQKPPETEPATDQLIFEGDRLSCPIHVSQQHFTTSAVSLVLVSAFTAPVTHQV
jgi:hypothetical protein